MAEITGLTANRMKEIENKSIVNGAVRSDNLWLINYGGQEFNVGSVVGPAGRITSATASTLAPGSNATVTLGGTATARTMAFGIPRGDKGERGNTGAAGITENASGITNYDVILIDLTPQVVSSMGSIRSLYLYVSGSTATLVVDRYKPINTTNNDILLSSDGLPEEYRPSRTVYDTISTMGDVGNTSEIVVGVGGQVTQFNVPVANVNYTGAISWPVKSPVLQGAAGKISSVTATTLAAGASATVTAGGTVYDRTFNFGIPRGATGASGTITAATATALEAGASPTVTLGGTSSARTMNFGIPKGDKGDKGDTGNTGDSGIWVGTLAQYNAIATKDPVKLYFIKG